MFSFLSGGEKRTRKESHKPAWVGPLRPPVSGACVCLQKIFCGFFFFVLFLSVKEKEPKRKLRNPPGLARCARPSAALAFPAKIFCGAFLSEKPRREKWVTDEGGGRPNRRETNAAGRAARWPAFIPLPDKVSFLWFFRSFPERKERTDHCAPDARKAGDGTPDGLRASPLPVKVSFLWFFRSFPERKERTFSPSTVACNAGCGPSAGLRANPPDKVSFLWFFRSFPERKERTERKRKRNVKAKGSCVSRRPCPRPV